MLLMLHLLMVGNINGPICHSAAANRVLGGWTPTGGTTKHNLFFHKKIHPLYQKWMVVVTAKAFII